jgi:uncharacterized coiled-coil DUF342 family protein
MSPVRPSRYRSAVAQTQEQRDERWAQLDELTERAAKTDERIETLKQDIAEFKEYLTQVQRRLAAHCH